MQAGKGVGQPAEVEQPLQLAGEAAQPDAAAQPPCRQRQAGQRFDRDDVGGERADVAGDDLDAAAVDEQSQPLAQQRHVGTRDRAYDQDAGARLGVRSQRQRSSFSRLEAETARGRETHRRSGGAGAAASGLTSRWARVA